MIYYKGKSSDLKKSYGTFDMLMFGLGNTLGPQVFIMLGGLVAVAGPYGIISLMVCAVICFLIAMLYLELALSMPIAGLVVNSVNDAFGGFASFIVGWSQLFGNISFAAVSAIGFGMFMGSALIAPLIVVIVISGLALRGITELKKFNIMLVVVITGFFLSLIVANAGKLTAVADVAFSFGELSSMSKILLGIGFFFLAFTGFEDVSTYSEEAKDIRKLPIVMFMVVFIISLLFSLIYLLLVGAIVSGNELVFSDPLLFLSRSLYGGISHTIIAGIGMAATLSTLVSSLSTSARNILSMSEKGFMPKQLYKVTESGVPTYAVILSAFFTVIIIFAGNLELLVYLGNFLYFFITFFLALTLIKLREKRKKLERPFKVPLSPLLPMLTAALMLVLVFFLDIKSVAFGFIWLFFGFILYMLRVVGEYRLKIAVIGGNVICAMLSVFVIAALEELMPAIFISIRPLLIVSLFLLLVFSFVLVLDSIDYAKTHDLYRKHPTSRSEGYPQGAGEGQGQQRQS